jgi:Helicase conserved C-terminal domain
MYSCGRALTGSPRRPVNRPLAWFVSALRSRLGAVAPAEQVSAELDRLGVREPLVAGLLTWLAGPYLPLRERPAWLSSSNGPVVSRTAACLNEDGGVRRFADVQGELADVGIRVRNLRLWLPASGAVLVHDLAVSAKGPLTDVVERLLDAHGEARWPEQIAADVAAAGRQVDAEDLARVLRNRRRFTRSTRGDVSLVSWGQEKSRGRPKARTTPAKSAERSAASTSQPPTPVARETTERLWLWVRVDAEVLRGSEAAVPVALVEGLGLAPLARRTFSSRWGPVALVYDAPQPRRARAILTSCGLRAGAMHSSLPARARAEVFDLFATGELQVLAAPRVLDEGVDVPAADVAVIIGASRSRRQIVQRMGRVLRRKADGRHARFVVVFVEDSVEDPSSGAHETFLDEVVNVAEGVSRLRIGATQGRTEALALRSTARARLIPVL